MTETAPPTTPAVAKQASAMPTRKVAAFALMTMASEAALAWSQSLAASSEAFAWLTNQPVVEAIPVLAGFGVAWLVSDSPNNPPADPAKK